MRAHDCRIDHLQCRVRYATARKRLQDHVPQAAVGPTPELPKDRIPVAELVRQIAPWRAGSHQPEHRVEHTAMVARRATAATDQERCKIRPLFVGHQSANQGRPPQRAALNQFSIVASIDLSTRPNITVVIFCWCICWIVALLFSSCCWPNADATSHFIELFPSRLEDRCTREEL